LASPCQAWVWGKAEGRVAANAEQQSATETWNPVEADMIAEPPRESLDPDPGVKVKRHHSDADRLRRGRRRRRRSTPRNDVGIRRPSANVLEGTDPRVDPLLDLREDLGQVYANARIRLVATGQFEALDLRDRHAETPEGADDADAPEGRFIEQPVVGRRPTGRTDEAVVHLQPYPSSVWPPRMEAIPQPSPACRHAPPCHDGPS
jgi:hypothetical protein